MNQLPSDFDVALVGDDSTLPVDALEALRELVWRKCALDTVWFIENFWHIIDPKSFGWVLFKLREYQHSDVSWLADAVASPNRQRKLVLKARQIGWTTAAAAVAFHDVFFQERHPWLIASQGEDEAKDTLTTKIKDPYEMLPLWMRDRGPKITDSNSERLTLDNGSSILSIAATARAGRSKAVFGVLLDEFAFAGDPGGMLTALTPLCYGPLIVFSTAFGMGNPFHALWVESQRHDSEWDARFRPWNVVPGRDEAWYAREKRSMRGKESEFYQEYPSSPEEAFAKTGRTVLPMDILREQHWCAPTWRLDLHRLNLAEPWLLQGPEHLWPIETDVEADHELWVWEPPLVDRDDKGRMLRTPNYVLGCDVAEGLEHGDRTSIWVWDANTLEVVATYLGYWPVEDLGELLEYIGYAYHTALIVGERNNHGILPLDYLRRVQYPRLYRMESMATQIRGDRTPRYGWHTNKASKPKMVNDYIKALRDDVVVMHDSRFLQEATVFVADGKGAYSAIDGAHDDHVIACLIGYQGCMDVGQYPTTYYDDTPYRLTWRDIAALGAPPPKPSALLGGIGVKTRKDQTQRSFVV